jgi:hypothetical protein
MKKIAIARNEAIARRQIRSVKFAIARLPLAMTREFFYLLNQKIHLHIGNIKTH